MQEEYEKTKEELDKLEKKNKALEEQNTTLSQQKDDLSIQLKVFNFYSHKFSINRRTFLLGQILNVSGCIF